MGALLLEERFPKWDGLERDGLFQTDDFGHVHGFNTPSQFTLSVANSHDALNFGSH